MGLALARFSREKFNIEFDSVLEILIGGIIFGIIGARAYYVLFRLDYYLANPSQILRIRDGGIAIYGAIIAIIIFVLTYCQKKKIDFFDLADYLIPYLALGQSIGRWGNFFNIEAYGSNTTSIFRMGITVASEYIEVHPVFLYESICTLAIFIILSAVKRKRKFQGQIFYLYFILYGFVRMLLEGLRTDSLWLGPIRVSQALSGLLFIVFLAMYISAIRYHKNNKQDNK